ncbi:MAG: tRNA (N6-isopentenyl adenosine(37)-C2)-methylthiotransferase MiaB [Actinomycetota bacterium]|nr:tRNA (N6-isopentenyl adenosine(37)-C2)-methylthiotransferase MiaB [Actinomycetota bacterium]
MINKGYKTFYIKTFGCQMNLHDSEKISTILSLSGFTRTNRPSHADLIIYNTCCVRENAENKFYGQVQTLKMLKESRPGLKIAIGGCLAQSEGERILSKFDHVDLVFGTGNYMDILSLLSEVEHLGQGLAKTDVSSAQSDVLATDRENQKKSWVTISTGCNNFCTYCIVPYVRGPEISRPMDEIISEVKRLAEEGVLEITLLGQNVNSYGSDLYDGPRFHELLERLDVISGIRRIRFTTSHPKDFDDHIIKAMSGSKKICKHIHLPLQSGSDRILMMMGRRYLRGDYLKIIESINSNLPGCNITTDIMVGFPGEGEDDFLETLELVERARFGNAFTFIYSPRKGTKAFDMEVNSTDEVVLDRFNRLLNLQNDMGLQLNEMMVGDSFEVLVDGFSKKDGAILTGRTACNRVVNFPGPSDLINQFTRVKIEEARSWSLKGRVIETR